MRSIISEFKIKIKEFEYIVKKQWITLKKFNLQEKIYREESKSLADNESMKRKDIYKNAIEKLTAAHNRGFEPAGVLKNKILNKIQIKYDISENIMKDLSCCFNIGKYYEEEENLLKTRYEDQVKVLEKFIKSNISVNNPSQNNVNNQNNSLDKMNSIYNPYNNNKYIREKDPEYLKIYHMNKQDLKRYEKELEMKAGKGGFVMEENHKNLEEFYLNQSVEMNGDVMRNSDEVKNTKILNESFGLEQPDIEFQEINYRSNPIFKVKDILKCCDAEKILKFKEKIVQDFKGKIFRESTNILHNSNSIEMNTQSIENLSHVSSPNQTLYKSKILNDLYV